MRCLCREAERRVSADCSQQVFRKVLAVARLPSLSCRGIARRHTSHANNRALSPPHNRPYSCIAAEVPISIVEKTRDGRNTYPQYAPHGTVRDLAYHLSISNYFRDLLVRVHFSIHFYYRMFFHFTKNVAYA
jgi:hypothetical protein